MTKRKSHIVPVADAAYVEGKNSQNASRAFFGEFLHKKFNQSRIGKWKSKWKKKIGRRASKLAGGVHSCIDPDFESAA